MKCPQGRGRNQDEHLCGASARLDEAVHLRLCRHRFPVLLGLTFKEPLEPLLLLFVEEEWLFCALPPAHALVMAAGNDKVAQLGWLQTPYLQRDAWSS